MRVKLQNVQLQSVISWLPTNNLEMRDLVSEYGEADVNTVIKTTGIERARIADKDMCSSDMCQKAAEGYLSFTENQSAV